MNDEIVDYSRKWYVMVAVGTSFFLATIDESIVNLALPTLVRDLNTDFPTVQWVVLAYLLTQTTLMLTVGRLGDLLGKKAIFTAGFIVFTLGSILSGLAPTVYWLIAFRALQAVGAAMALALGFALVTEAFPPGERGKALGISTTIVSLGIVLGPTVGGRDHRYSILALDFLRQYSGWYRWDGSGAALYSGYQALRLAAVRLLWRDFAFHKPACPAAFAFLGAAPRLSRYAGPSLVGDLAALLDRIYRR